MTQPPKAYLTGNPPPSLSQERVVELLRANGHDAFLSERRVLVRVRGRLFRVVGGDFRHPTLVALGVADGSH